MPHTRLFTIEGASVSDNGTESLTESDDESWMITEVQVFEESGTTLDGSTGTISISGDSVTDQNIVLASLQEPYAELPPMDLEWPSNTQFELSYTNDSGGSTTLNVLLWVEPMSGSGA